MKYYYSPMVAWIRGMSPERHQDASQPATLMFRRRRGGAICPSLQVRSRKATMAPSLYGDAEA
jgi:hypothetical protein